MNYTRFLPSGDSFPSDNFKDRFTHVYVELQGTSLYVCVSHLSEHPPQNVPHLLILSWFKFHATFLFIIHLLASPWFAVIGVWRGKLAEKGKVDEVVVATFLQVLDWGRFSMNT